MKEKIRQLIPEDFSGCVLITKGEPVLLSLSGYGERKKEKYDVRLYRKYFLSR